MWYSEPPAILITDDDVSFRETLQEVFHPEGFRTWLAGDGEEALRIVEREPVHLVVTDMYMPKLNGLDMIRLLRTIRASLPCILLSSQPDPWLLEEADRAQVFSVLPKPFSRQAIVALVRDALRTNYAWPGR